MRAKEENRLPEVKDKDQNITCQKKMDGNKKNTDTYIKVSIVIKLNDIYKILILN
jgi:hypothetical protein